MTKQTILSGIRASGRLHIGNYLGALKQFAKLQEDNKNNCFYFIADLHALTTKIESKELKQNTLEVAAEYLAAGINPKKSIFFIQSQVLEHANLGWIFNCNAPLGELYRMTEYKDKAKLNPSNINAGLLTYPTLMAADILLYKPTLVPVGEDQTQHLEITRIVARKFNKQFGKTFPEPKNFALKPLRIKSLKDPNKKMSKTPHQSLRSGTGQAGNEGALFVDDSPKDIQRKLKKAVTATAAGKKSPGEENLMLMLAHFGKKDEIAYFADAQNSGTLKYSELKETLAKDIAEYFKEFREKKKELLAKPSHLARILAEGSEKARSVAHKTLLEVKQKMGLL